MISGRALPTRTVAKPWGRDVLPPPFGVQNGERIGEIWFEPPPELSDLLVKYLFTSENLSVQVHPSDAQAPAGERGKDECWLIVSAEPGAQLALGLTHPAAPHDVHQAAVDGSIESLLEWHDVAVGDFFYIPAGTIHAIGAGISLIEVQQNSDVTFRLYDYGRPRDLHLNQALSVAMLGPHDPKLRKAPAEKGAVTLVEGPHFRLDRVCGPPDGEVAARYGDRPLLVVPLDACVELGDTAIGPGGCGVAPVLTACTFAVGAHALVAQPVFPALT